MMVTLGIAGMCSGLAIVGIFLVTQPMIERNRAEALEAAIYRVLEGAKTRVALVLREGKLTRFESPDGSLPKEEAVYAGYDEAGALLVVIANPIISLGMLKPPGDYGADVVVAEGQPLGAGLNFGGPYLGVFAARDQYVRRVPGRLVGETTDTNGQRGYVLTSPPANSTYGARRPPATSAPTKAWWR